MKIVFILALLAFCLAGCDFLQRAGEAATTPNPALGGKTPVQAVIEKAPGLLFNPIDPVTWAIIIQALVVTIAGGLGLKKVRKENLANTIKAIGKTR